MATTASYFIGLALPADLSRHVAEYKMNLHTSVKDVIKPLIPHITLLHPPSLKDVPQQELVPKIQEVAASHLPLTITLESIGAFDSAVLYVRADSAELAALQAELAHLLPPAAQSIYHERGFIPHVTLAQVRPPHALDIETLSVLAAKEFTLPYEFTASAISCFTRTGPREYRAEPVS